MIKRIVRENKRLRGEDAFLKRNAQWADKARLFARA